MAKKELLNNDALTLRVAEDGVIENIVEGADKVAKSTQNIISETLDVMEETIDLMENQVERVVTITKNNPFVVAGAFVIGLAIGGFVSYKVTQKRLSAQFDEELTEQIAAAKAWRTRLSKEGEFETPESTVEALIPDAIEDTVNAYRGRAERVPYNNPDDIVVADPRPPVEVVVEELKVTQNVFVDADNNATDTRDWDYNAEIADRELLTNGEPYAISFEEFNENALGHEQVTMTYYAGDDTLADTNEKPVDSVDYTIGNENLTRFGDGSHDPNVVYIRNTRIDVDFEVIRSNGTYQQEVLGIAPEPSIKHSRREGRQRWRTDE